MYFLIPEKDVNITEFCNCIIDVGNSNDHLYKLKGIFGVVYYDLATEFSHFHNKFITVRAPI